MTAPTVEREDVQVVTEDGEVIVKVSEHKLSIDSMSHLLLCLGTAPAYIHHPPVTECLSFQ